MNRIIIQWIPCKRRITNSQRTYSIGLSLVPSGYGIEPIGPVIIIIAISTFIRRFDTVIMGTTIIATGILRRRCSLVSFSCICRHDDRTSQDQHQHDEPHQPDIALPSVMAAATFSIMIFCKFRYNNPRRFRFAPNDFKYLIHLLHIPLPNHSHIMSIFYCYYLCLYFVVTIIIIQLYVL